MNPTGPIVSYLGSQPTVSKISTEKQPYDERHFRRRYINAIEKVASEWSKTKLALDHEYYKIQFSEPSFKLKSMSETFAKEQISYFTEAGLEERQVYVINGSIYNKDLSLYNSTTPLNAETGEGEMIVMDRLGNTFIAPKERGVFHHSSFFSGKPVAFAALCFVKDGKIQKMVRYSGHYMPGEDEESSFTQQMKTDYLVAEKALDALKIDSKGDLVQTIVMSSKQKVVELLDHISEIGGFNRPMLRLFGDGKHVPEARCRDNAFIDLTIAETHLKNGSTINALEVTYTPLHRVYPSRKYELIIRD
jgi:hypothetical protein